MAVPYTFGSATTSIPLSQLDSNFATTITLGNTAIQLGNTVTTLNNMTLANVTISSGTSNLASTSISNGTSNVTVNSSGGNITLGTAGTTAITITTGQLVGIGTASPTVQLLNIAATSVSGPTNNPAGIQLTDSGASLSSQIVNRSGNTLHNVPSTKAHSFQVNSTETVGVNTYGIGLGGTTPTSGMGIAFPATQSASSDANTLDDYEEGTWTPTDQSGAGLSLTVASNPSYTKIGRMVTVMANITYPSTASGSNTLLGGLPFTSATSANGGDPGGFLRYSNFGSGVWVEVLSNATTFRLWTLTGTNVTNANASTKRFDFVMTYFV